MATKFVPQIKLMPSITTNSHPELIFVGCRRIREDGMCVFMENEVELLLTMGRDCWEYEFLTKRGRGISSHRNLTFLISPALISLISLDVKMSNFTIAAVISWKKLRRGSGRLAQIQLRDICTRRECLFRRIRDGKRRKRVGWWHIAGELGHKVLQIELMASITTNSHPELELVGRSCVCEDGMDVCVQVEVEAPPQNMRSKQRQNQFL